MAHVHHDHAHGHHHTVRVPGSPDEERRLRTGLILIGSFTGAEFLAGLLAGSLALLADSAHMLSDVLALGLALAAARVARRPAAGALTYGFGRAEILSAQANGLLLGILGLLIAGEGVVRLISPGRPGGAVMIAVALVGAAVNLVAVRAMSGGSGLNMEGALQHLLTDLYGFLATAAAGGAILLSGFARADALASLLVAGLMLRSSGSLLLASGRVFMEAAPAGLEPSLVGRALAARSGVVEVHDLHIWEVTSGFPALSAHVVVAAGDDCHARRRELQELLRERFGLAHTTLQVDHEAASQLPLQIERPGATLPGMTEKAKR